MLVFWYMNHDLDFYWSFLKAGLQEKCPTHNNYFGFLRSLEKNDYSIHWIPKLLVV